MTISTATTTTSPNRAPLAGFAGWLVLTTLWSVDRSITIREGLTVASSLLVGGAFHDLGGPAGDLSQPDAPQRLDGEGAIGLGDPAQQRRAVVGAHDRELGGGDRDVSPELLMLPDGGHLARHRQLTGTDLQLAGDRLQQRGLA